MGAGKNKSHRKKRISKHVLEAAEKKNQEQLENNLISAAQGEALTDGTTDGKQTDSSKSNSKVKDPIDAASYLTLWNHDRNNKTGAWKFNKNTQSWLLRHMYNAEKVNKTTFGILVEYICCGGEGTRSRVEEEAKQKAIRYKEWEKKGDSESKSESDTQVNATTETIWCGLSDHDKRKEYKRARKVMEALKAVRNKNES